MNTPITVSISPNGSVQLDPSSPLFLTASASESGVTYTWYNGSTPTGSNSNSLSVSASGNYSVKITNGVCSAVSATVHVAQTNAPTVNIIVPASHSTFEAPADFVLSAQASDADGTITKVEFYQNDVKIGESVSQPYELSIAALPTGEYTYYAVATDNKSLSATSSNVLVTVTEKPVPTQVVLTATYDQSSTGSGNGSIHIHVDINNNGSNSVIVEIYDGTTLLTTLTNAPYEYVYNNPSVGMHEINVNVSDGTTEAVTQTKNVNV